MTEVGEAAAGLLASLAESGQQVPIVFPQVELIGQFSAPNLLPDRSEFSGRGSVLPDKDIDWLLCGSSWLRLRWSSQSQSGESQLSAEGIANFYQCEII